MKNEITEPKAKSLMAAMKDYTTSIGNGLKDIIGNITPYQAVCGYNILAQINVQLSKEGLAFNSPNVDKETINNAIKYALVYSLNTDNREVFVIVRNENRGTKQAPKWVKVIEVKPQYKGVLKILSSFGRDVERVYPEWIVREGDGFKYQIFRGIEVIPPEWEPHGTNGKILRVVVPIKYKDGTIDYRIAERESVATNIKAQIKQTLMKSPETKKDEILAKIQDMSLEDLLSDKTLATYVNETYTGLSRDEMLITKLILNAVKRVQIDYSSALARELNEKTFDNADVYTKSHNAEEVLAMSHAPMLEVNELETEEEAPTKTVDEDGVVSEEEPLNAQFIKAKEEAAKAEKNKTTTDDDFYSLFEDND